MLLAIPALATPPPGAPSCSVFPADNVWHSDISGLPVHARSAAWLGSMNASTRRLHPDFGPSGKAQPYGIPYIAVPSSHEKVSIEFTYADESDPGPYPFGPETPIEMGSDRHALMIDSGTCTLYELFDATYSSGGSTAGSGAIWSLRSNALRPAGWTSADAAGLPIFAGLVRLDEVKAGVVDHAIRVTASRTDRSFVWPARHQAGAANDPNLPPMGARFRLKASYNISGFRPDTRAILSAMKKHGLILADNGSDWYFTGTSEDGWSSSMLDELKSVPASAFEAVDASSLMIDPNSGRARSTTIPPPTTTKPKPKPPSSPAAAPAASPSPSASSSPTPTQISSPTPEPTSSLLAAPTREGPSSRAWLWVVGAAVVAAPAVALAIRRRASRVAKPS